MGETHEFTQRYEGTQIESTFALFRLVRPGVYQREDGEIFSVTKLNARYKWVGPTRAPRKPLYERNINGFKVKVKA